jgi:protease-4
LRWLTRHGSKTPRHKLEFGEQELRQQNHRDHGESKIMSLSADMMVDRRALRRKLTFWRVAAILVAIVALVGAGLAWSGALGAGQPHIARIRIDGLITGSQATLDLIRRAETGPAKAVILRINSGGGTTAGSEALYNEVRRLAAKKPVVAVIDSVGASGAYMTALGSDRIIANGSAIVGSVGVIAQIPNVTKLLDTLGIKVEAVRSSPLKAMPNGIEPTTPEARAALEATVLDTYAWFRDLVGDRRKLQGEALAKVTDGRVFTGRQSIDLKLIDAIGNESDAIEWLKKEKGIDAKAQMRTYSPPSRRFSSLTSLAGLAAFVTGGDSDALGARAREILGPSALDGLVSLWHPARE